MDYVCQDQSQWQWHCTGVLCMYCTVGVHVWAPMLWSHVSCPDSGNHRDSALSWRLVVTALTRASLRQCWVEASCHDHGHHDPGGWWVKIFGPKSLCNSLKVFIFKPSENRFGHCGPHKIVCWLHLCTTLSDVKCGPSSRHGDRVSQNLNVLKVRNVT